MALAFEFVAESATEESLLAYLRSLADLNVGFERAMGRYVALDLEPGADIDAVRDRLDAAVADGVLEYETCEARVAGSFDDAPEP